jgi:hypothetical protein
MENEERCYKINDANYLSRMKGMSSPVVMGSSIWVNVADELRRTSKS